MHEHYTLVLINTNGAFKARPAATLSINNNQSLVQIATQHCMLQCVCCPC